MLTPVATSSGEALEQRVGDPGEHAELGDQLIWFVIPLLRARRSPWSGSTAGAARPAAPADGHRPDSRRRLAPTVLAALAVVAALASTVQVYRVGDSGARAAWGDARLRQRLTGAEPWLTVGLCEDDPAIRRVVTQALGLAGHEVADRPQRRARRCGRSARTARST